MIVIASFFIDQSSYEFHRSTPGHRVTVVIAVRVRCVFGLRREPLGLVLRAWSLGQPLVELKLVSCPNALPLQVKKGTFGPGS